jgi:hypothetical protein
LLKPALVSGKSNLMKLLIAALLAAITIIASSAPRSFSAEQPSDIAAWLKAHVGEGEGQIAQVVLQRARALYFQKVHEGITAHRRIRTRF